MLSSFCNITTSLPNFQTIFCDDFLLSLLQLLLLLLLRLVTPVQPAEHHVSNQSPVVVVVVVAVLVVVVVLAVVVAAVVVVVVVGVVVVVAVEARSGSEYGKTWSSETVLPVLLLFAEDHMTLTTIGQSHPVCYTS